MSRLVSSLDPKPLRQLAFWTLPWGFRKCCYESARLGKWQMSSLSDKSTYNTGYIPNSCQSKDWSWVDGEVVEKQIFTLLQRRRISAKKKSYITWILVGETILYRGISHWNMRKWFCRNDVVEGEDGPNSRLEGSHEWQSSCLQPLLPSHGSWRSRRWGVVGLDDLSAA